MCKNMTRLFLLLLSVMGFSVEAYAGADEEPVFENMQKRDSVLIGDQIRYGFRTTVEDGSTLEVAELPAVEGVEIISGFSLDTLKARRGRVEIEGSVVLTFPDDNSDNNKINGYDEPWTAISGDYSFTMTAFNNYEWNNWTYVRCGRKSASVAYIETDDAMPRLSSVEVEIGSRFDSADVNDLYLAVYSDAAMTRQVGENIEAEGEWTTNTVLTYNIPESVQADNLYYQLTFDCAASSKGRNGLIEVSKVTYIAAE